METENESQQDGKANALSTSDKHEVYTTVLVVYTYEECAFIFDRAIFVSILIFVTVLTVSFFSAIINGGENSLQ